MRTADDLPDGIRELVVRGRDAWQQRDYRAARQLFDQTLDLSLSSGDRFGQLTAYHFLGNVAFNQCRDEESRLFHTKALELARADGDEQGIATSLGSLALIDVAEGRFDSAERQFRAAIDAYLRADMSDSADRLRATADTLVTRREPLETHVQRQFDRSSPH